MANVTISTDEWIESGSPVTTVSTDKWAFTTFTLPTLTLSTDLWSINFGLHKMFNAGTNGKLVIAPVAGTTNNPQFDGSAVTTTRTYTLPDASGTVQLTSGTGNFVDNETPSGTIDGANVTFTLAHAPNPASSLQLILNGAYQTAVGADYTLSTLTITFNSAPVNGSVLRAFYRY